MLTVLFQSTEEGVEGSVLLAFFLPIDFKVPQVGFVKNKFHIFQIFRIWVGDLDNGVHARFFVQITVANQHLNLLL